MRALFLVSLLSLAPLAAAQDAPTLQDAAALFQAEQFAEARDAYRQIAEREPENRPAHYWLALSHQHLGHDADAVAVFDALIAGGPTVPVAWVHLAGSHARLGDHAAAFGALDGAVGAGFVNVALLETNPLLDPLREDARFAEVVAGAQLNATPCQSSEPHRQFDFWVGSWEVVNAAGQVLGTNEIESQEQGCFLMERWTSASGGTGSSLNHYNPATGLWNQLWVAAGGGQTAYQGSFAEGAMRFEGIQTALNGTTALRRMTFTPLDDGRVRQFIEASTDNGETWTAAFDGYYVRTE